MRFKKLEKYDYIQTKKEALEQLEYLRQEYNYMLEQLDKWISKNELITDWLKERITSYEEYEALDEKSDGTLTGYKRTLYELEKIERDCR